MPGVKGKPKVTRMRKLTLHQPPPDVAEASKHPLLDPYDPKSWVRYSDYLLFMEGRNMKMPAHRRPLTEEERWAKHRC